MHNNQYNPVRVESMDPNPFRVVAFIIVYTQGRSLKRSTLG